MEKTNWLRDMTRMTIIGVAAGVFLLAGCTEQDGGAAPPAPTASASATGGGGGGGGSFNVGETVEVTGTVVADGGTFGFDIMPDGGSEPVPVISVKDLLIGEGDRVTVKGRVVSFDAATLERELGVDLNDDWVRRNSGRNAIVASSVKH